MPKGIQKVSSRWLTQAQAAEYLAVTERTIRNYIARGVLHARRINGSRAIRISQEDLDAMLRPIASVDNGGDAA